MVLVRDWTARHHNIGKKGPVRGGGGGGGALDGQEACEGAAGVRVEASSHTVQKIGGERGRDGGLHKRKDNLLTLYGGRLHCFSHQRLNAASLGLVPRIHLNDPHTQFLFRQQKTHWASQREPLHIEAA